MTDLPPFTRGLHDLGGGCHAWLEPPGGWGYANSGVVLGTDEVLVVDTQNDLALGTALRAAVDVVAGHRAVTTVVNTHSDGDHWNGNLLYEGARIIASEATVGEMKAMWLEPDRMAELARGDTAFGRFIAWRIATFDFNGWRPVLPTESFSGGEHLVLGDQEVELVEVGPAHTRGDTIVHVPSAGVVYAGDVLFTESTPIVWAGPVTRCIAALDRVLDRDPRIVVPGHGPVVRPADVMIVRNYFEFLLEFATGAHRAGKTPAEAYSALDLGPYARWPHASRAYQNILAVYRELDPEFPAVPPPQALEVVLADDDGTWTAGPGCGHTHSTAGPGA
ncbi:MBL fold metallo-hydrolase [Saccharopolyspora sp. ASAGF58]|uniref:MBL fold metallo-hydrolase n=1 Tax=Saccharopolyspora sp. ASAGF58 TaxID=2719023 RepID=UPI00144650C4|nr:MBL fold metallo-hydrolase [Saccharopolyspora sp. ASAGF58]